MIYENLDAANKSVVDKIISAQPFLIDVVPAKTVIRELESMALLHAGPPLEWEDMTEPMQGSCFGAVIFEGWAYTKEEAEKILSEGKVKFIPCHDVDAVGPMGGITSANMPVLVVENRENGNRAYCTLNEGIGKVLRFGAYGDEVIRRLHWIKNVLGPSLSKALNKIEGGMNLNVIVSKAITMGDEFHQRNIAASALFMKDIMPSLLESDIDEKDLFEVTKFLADTDQFFLNIAMAYCKSVMDAAKSIGEGTIVTAMTRNGNRFAIKVSGLGETWFTAPVNMPKGLFFTGYSQEDANLDMGDSTIVETFGIGGMAMIAAPGVTRFVGADGFNAAMEISEEMEEISVGHNPNLAIPTWDFKGALVGIDVRKVVETGITPLINTGIAHKKAGVGQIGAGTVRAPYDCFAKALEGLVEKYASDKDN
ncbi:DUF1116 domain-containing protein [Gudongella sp. DL1XJH-153]|uniref:DUF1116 domain-containing protein n=1 Tax=Gudongella sp. DL1XJH-153 TaxID=3409804 RepID=UPI003BB718B0